MSNIIITAETGADFEKVLKNADFETIYKNRREKVYSYLREAKIAAIVFNDSEDRREPAVRYLTGHPSDAVLMLTAEGKSYLMPWDENLAKERAHCDQVLPYTSFGRKATTAIAKILEGVDAGDTKVVAIPPSTSYPAYTKYVEELKGWDVVCKENYAHKAVVDMRAQKDEYEIACTRKAGAITDEMTVEIVKAVKDGTFKTETDVALYIEKYLRMRGCEKASFDTLCAGPSRSFAIHAFPGYTAAEWGTKGLSILDYGVSYEGYASDCTITIARGPLNAEQNQLLDLVQKAADECIKLYVPGGLIHDAAAKADEIFASANLSMPHGLGHGTGLEIHEAPGINMRTTTEVFKPGHIVTLEPGLYDAKLGGTRLENDVLITDTGNVVLTHSEIFRI